MTDVQLGPSILTADLLNLGDSIAVAESAGVDFIHLDVMDGQFVPNITFGPLVVEAVRSATRLPLDVHLMIEQPERQIRAFIDAGADMITIHAEASLYLHAVLTEIRERGASPGVALNPATPLEVIAGVAPFVDQVLIMSVNPGFGGQSFIPTTLGRIERVRDLTRQINPSYRVEVDGGIKASNIGQVVKAGASMIVAGSAIFSDHTPVAEAVLQLRAAIAAAERSGE